MQIESDRLWEIVAPRLRDQVTRGRLSVEFIAEFCGAAPLTVRRWLAGKTANGERLIRLWHLLALAGSDSPELAKLPPFNRYLGELVVFGILSPEEAQEVSGQSSPKVTQVYFTLRGTTAMHPHFTVEELSATYGERLAEAKTAFRAAIISMMGDSEPAPTPTAEAQEPAQPSPEPAIRLKGGDFKVTLSALLGAAAPLARHLNSDKCTPADRSAFRELLGSEVLFDLTNTLGALSSERARGLAR